MSRASGPVDAPRRRLRTRLLFAMFAIAFGVLIVAALGAAGLARSTASSAAVRDLKRKAPSVANEITVLTRRFRQSRNRANTTTVVCPLIAGVLRISGASVVEVTPDGSVNEGIAPLLNSNCANRGNVDLPSDVHPSDLNVDMLIVGQQQSGVVNRTAFVAQPLPLLGTNTPVLVITQGVETQPLGRAGPYFLLTGGLALLLAAIVSAYLARRVTKPIAAMRDTAQRIASGDLSARVGSPGGPDDELRSLARSLDAMAAELETARGHERAFLLSVSHDLRTPLTSIRGYAEAIRDGLVEDSGDRARAGSIIAAEARRLERLVADLLDLARLDAHQFSLHPRSVDARSVVYDAVAGFVPSARDWGVRLEVMRGDPAPVEVDPERLAQITANLVENALKYATATVRVDVARQDGRVELRVDDDGPGIPADDRDRVFERLYTARGAAARKVGTGIGLAIVHELAGAMGGAASWEALDAGGTRFTVTIPAGAGAPAR